jgi:hypothetical protein
VPVVPPRLTHFEYRTTLVNIPLLVLLPALSMHAADDVVPSLYQPGSALESAVSGQPPEPVVVRGQSPSSPAPLYTPGVDGTTTFYPPTYLPDGTTSTVTPFAPTTPYYSPAPITSDPWLGGTGGTPLPYGAPAGVPQGFYTFGLNGPRPYRFGFTERLNVGFLPDADTSSPDRGEFGIFEFDFEKDCVQPAFYNWVFTASPQFNYRAWDGPEGLPGPAHLPGSVYRFGLNLKLATPQVSGWSAEVGFNPAIGTDFQAFDGDAWFFDAHGVAFWQWSPQWTWALGAAYWDRVDDIIIPYAGVVWIPNDDWEFRLVFPNPRISYFLGTPYGVATWIYAGLEYHVEAYYIDLDFANVDTRVQYEDWRIYGGLRFEAGQFVTFVECGGAVGRNVEFEEVGQKFDVDSGFFARAGLRW